MNNIEQLKSTYPDTISSEQLRIILHISKRKAAWMLNNGFIKCIINENQTRKYTIKLDDVIGYIEDSELHPEHYHTPDGIFTAGANKCAEKYGFPQALPTDDFRAWLADEWSDVSDVLTNDDVSELTGYCIDAVNRWINKKWLRSVITQEETVISRDWLIDYYCGNGYNIAHMNEKHAALMKKYFKR